MDPEWASKASQGVAELIGEPTLLHGEPTLLYREPPWLRNKLALLQGRQTSLALLMLSLH